MEKYSLKCSSFLYSLNSRQNYNYETHRKDLPHYRTTSVILITLLSFIKICLICLSKTFVMEFVICDNNNYKKHKYPMIIYCKQMPSGHKLYEIALKNLSPAQCDKRNNLL